MVLFDMVLFDMVLFDAKPLQSCRHLFEPSNVLVRILPVRNTDGRPFLRSSVQAYLRSEQIRKND